VIDRLDYVSTTTQELLRVQVLEKLILCYRSSFVSICRSILLEFYRNMNHNSNTTTHAIDTGLFTTTSWTSEEREKLINFNECISGTRFHATFISIGRLRYDISLFWIDASIYWLIHHARQLKEIHNILSINQSWSPRLYEIGILSKVFRLYFGLSGILSRPVNTSIDARFTGYEFYESSDYPSSTTTTGDRPDRYILRTNEIIESCRIIYAIIYVLLTSLHLSNIWLRCL